MNELDGEILGSILGLYLIIGSFNHFLGDKKLFRLLGQTWTTLTEEWYRLLILSFIAGGAYVKYNNSKPKEEHYFHVFLEFLGVFVLFLIVEHAIKKLSSGISDPESLPINDFINEVGNASNELILFDTVLETMMLDDNYATKLKIALKKAFRKSDHFSVRILILDAQSPFAVERAKHRGIKEDIFLKRIANVRLHLFNMKKEIETNTKYEGKIKINEYKSSPPFAIYSIDSKAYVSFFPKKKKTTDSRQLLIPNDTELGKEIYGFFYSKFESMWKEESKEINL